MFNRILLGIVLLLTACSPEPRKLGTDIRFPPGPGSGGLSSVAVSAPIAGDGSNGNPVNITAASAIAAGSLAAADFSKLATIPSGASVRATFISDQVDLVTAADYAFTGWPSLPGYKLADLTIRWIITNVAATTFATTATWQFGNDATFSNMVASNTTTPTAANLNAMLAAASGGPYGSAASFSILAVIKLPDLTTPPKIRVTTGATGTAITQAKARMMVTGLFTTAFATN